MASPGQPETVFSHDKKARQRVTEEELHDAPFQQVMRVLATMGCCEGRQYQGTCWLLKNDKAEDGSIGYLVTARHVLFCEKHCKFAVEVSVFAYWDGTTITKVLQISHAPGSPSGKPGWYRVCDRNLTTNACKRSQNFSDDYGVIAFYYADVKDDVLKDLVDQAKAFRVKTDALPQNIQNAVIVGYPLQVFDGSTLNNANVDMFKHTGPIDLHNCPTVLHPSQQVWSYRIDTSPGQSGAPVFVDDRRAGAKTVVGMHIRADIPGSDGANYALVLGSAVLEEIFDWPKCFQPNPGKYSKAPNTKQGLLLPPSPSATIRPKMAYKDNLHLSTEISGTPAGQITFESSLQ